VEKKKHKALRQVYRVKKDENLKKKDLAQDKENLVVQEISASFVDQIVPNDAIMFQKNIAAQQSSSAGGKTGAKLYVRQKLA
jgi:hypothetical protein